MGLALNPTNLQARFASIESILDRHISSWVKHDTFDLDQPVGASG